MSNTLKNPNFESMKFSLILFSLATILFFSCTPKKENTDKEQKIKDSIAACSADTTEMLNPNGETALALLMRQMDEDLTDFKMIMKRGEVPSVRYNHESILTAEPTKKELKGDDDYKAYANSYLMGIENLKNAPVDSIPAFHNKVVAKCIDCHRTYCTGPINRISKLRVNPENIDFAELD